uniref:Uncharacterized protein n=1 Tax=Arion vulgaris TaxID=1028688 RepID=A0A0B6Z404_9EUPU
MERIRRRDGMKEEGLEEVCRRPVLHWELKVKEDVSNLKPIITSGTPCQWLQMSTPGTPGQCYRCPCGEHLVQCYRCPCGNTLSVLQMPTHYH